MHGKKSSGLLEKISLEFSKHPLLAPFKVSRNNTLFLIIPSNTVQMDVRHTGPRKKTIYILVMGLTGAGKSTFISTVTENVDIRVGSASDMDGGAQLFACSRANGPSVTEEVQDYILFYRYEGVLYEIHLVDSPGFDDGLVNDARVLSHIATYVNTIFKLKKKLAGVLYLHDITKAKVGGVGLRHLRMLEQMIGKESYDNCTLVTTKWGCTNNPQDEEEREKTLSETGIFFLAACCKARNRPR